MPGRDVLQHFNYNPIAIPRHRRPFLISCFPDSVPHLENMPKPLNTKAMRKTGMIS